MTKGTIPRESRGENIFSNNFNKSFQSWKKSRKWLVTSLIKLTHQQQGSSQQQHLWDTDWLTYKVTRELSNSKSFSRKISRAEPVQSLIFHARLHNPKVDKLSDDRKSLWNAKLKQDYVDSGSEIFQILLQKIQNNSPGFTPCNFERWAPLEPSWDLK